ncbi:unnamed protein product [Heterosigma akashiwo]|uniref:non-specific serine/threonine protein kinase n=1 Tax=Heterosigma akashiwo TaxID=2829 RepID=A0A6V2SC80_HETAK|mmetsp:Transcript_41468/g.71415  ORF Transcript_41468/g.71415 Transcript_41468/m.71415 type:complete len:340 (+) Transcript_41468:85-1104(+)|eukprot:CAMPEP_0194575772 /NCGR_PEP_ID=MMETSP0292-20121207/11128_1 /TAXON_ID=39354 /ORGANISM="Heterosigma akashiwo, Strain CCMP2393" /LENGTH=339 /DNA_ID=CAMNT_0039427637 /DNA_START=91 /DNA_END=1110 /DNA_ORIENTATION=+
MGQIFSICLGRDDARPNSSNIEEDYDMGEELGKGAYGTVVRGTLKATGDEYAIKMVQREGMSQEDEDDLQLEVNILRKLDHEYIMNLQDYYQTPQCHYIVTELLVGGELFTRIEHKKQYNEKEAKDVMFIFFKAMAYVHENGIVHRDLKPENLLLGSKDDDEHFKVADFGLAGEIKNGQPLTQFAGTPLYICPEMLQEKPYSFPADVWSMGVICFILLGGYPPFFANNINALYLKIINGEYTFDRKYWKHISPEAKELIQRMLEVDPDKRITIADALQHPWIMTSDEALLQRDLSLNHKEFKKFQAKRRLKAAVGGVMALNRMQHMAHFEEFKKEQSRK